jgi:ubiquitin carboxyl-terminal hydrolase 4/11/15
MYLSLPLPIKKKCKTTIVYVPYDPSKRLQRVVVTLSKEASIAHLQKEVAKMMSVEDPNAVSIFLCSFLVRVIFIVLLLLALGGRNL